MYLKFHLVYKIWKSGASKRFRRETSKLQFTGKGKLKKLKNRQKIIRHH